MARLVKSELPSTSTRKPLYMEYVPIVKEFIDSDMDTAQVIPEEGDGADMKKLPTRLRAAIEHLGADDVSVCTRKENVYLVKIRETFGYSGGRAWRR